MTAVAGTPTSMIHLHSLYFVHGLVLLALGGAMLFPAALSTIMAEDSAGTFLAAAFVTLSIGGFFALLGRGHDMRLSRKSGFVLTASIWISVSLFGALPFAFGAGGLDYIDALFEAVSGLTTTGATVFVGLDTMPAGILLWRGLLQWIGGIGIVAMAILLLPFLQIGGMQLFRTESLGRGEALLRNARDAARTILTVYLVLNLACATIFWFQGMSVLDAVVHSMTAISTGGFTNHDASFGYFHSPSILLTTIFFMIAGALPAILFVRLGRGDWRAVVTDSQVRSFLFILLAALIAVTILLTRSARFELPDALLQAAFNVTAILTTTGFKSTDYAQWGAFAAAILVVLSLIGGCTGSAAGGIKIFRLEFLRKIVSLHVRRLLDTHAIVPIKYEGRKVDIDALSSVTAFVFIYLGTASLIALALALVGLDATTALTGAAAAVGNVGPGFGPIIGPAGTYAELPDAAKLILATGMLLGRLEFLTLIILFSPSFWRA